MLRPEGALAVANLKSRVGWWEGPPFGGGEWQFLYRGDTAALSQALPAVAAIRAPALALVLHDGPEENDLLKDTKKPDADTRIDWTFTVWVPANWHRLFNNPRSVFSAGNGEVQVYEILVPEDWSASQLHEMLPEGGCVPISLTRAGKATIPSRGIDLEPGDVIHVSATRKGYEELRRRLLAPPKGA